MVTPIVSQALVIYISVVSADISVPIDVEDSIAFLQLLFQQLQANTYY